MTAAACTRGSRRRAPRRDGGSARSKDRMSRDASSSKERLSPRDHLVENASKREDVAARVQRLPLRLLRGHLGHGSQNESLSRPQHPESKVGASDASPRSKSFARPKSRIITHPSTVTMMFSGFRSACRVKEKKACVAPALEVQQEP